MGVVDHGGADLNPEASAATTPVNDHRSTDDPSGEELVAHVRAEAGRPLPLPGHGATPARYEALAGIGARDLCVAKLAEPHHDATAILAELGKAAPEPGTLWGVWAAEPPHARVRARRDGESWQLSGTKAFCSGATLVTHALVTAEAEDGSRLFAVDIEAARSSGTLRIAGADWVGPGMRRAGTRTTDLHEVPAYAVGGPGDYVHRPGFWHGAVGVAACWLGGARAVAAKLEGTARRRELDPHASAHLGAVSAGLDAATAHLRATADRIDADPSDDAGGARRDAQSVRATVVAVAEDILTRVAHALGPAPLAFDAEHAQRVADLTVFIRQHHGERDLAELGRLVAGLDG
jgi:alkylation response protein AidB-like acyl-CoA dehydrogenase